MIALINAAQLQVFIVWHLSKSAIDLHVYEYRDLEYKQAFVIELTRYRSGINDSKCFTLM